MNADAVRILVVVGSIMIGAVFWAGSGPQAPKSTTELNDGSLVMNPIPRSSDTKAVEYFRLGTEELRNNNPVDAEHLYKEALRFAPDDHVIIQHLGLSLYNQLRLDEAEAYFRRVIELQPDHAPAHIGLGAISSHAKNHEQAAQHHLRAVSLRPDAALGQWGAGASLWVLGREDEAVVYLREFVRLLPNAKFAPRAEAWIAEYEQNSE